METIIAPDRGPWSQTYSGKKFYVLDPCPEDVDADDIAHQLSMICRYGGATQTFYSVAEHSILVARHVAPEYALEALLHDAAEAYIGDMRAPLKALPAFEAFCEIEVKLQSAIYARFGVASTPGSRAAIRDVDQRIRIDEVRALMRGGAVDNWTTRHAELKALNVKDLGHTSGRAEFLYRERLRDLLLGRFGMSSI